MNLDRHYDVILGPVITEKSTLLSEHGQVVFKVAMDATKPEIKAAVESLFKVEVSAVNTMIVKGKRTFYRGRRGRRPDRKKAVITLGEGHAIDVTTGL